MTMEETYKNLLQISELRNFEDKGGEVDLSRLAIMYQNTHDEVIFSKVFCELFYFTKSQLSKYFYLTEDDKISFALEELNKAMLGYDPTKGAEIQTMFNTYLNRRLYAESSMQNHQKRCLNNNPLCYDEVYSEANNIVNAGGENSNKPSEDSIKLISEEIQYKDVELNEALKQADLSDKELCLCTIIMKDNHLLKNTEIAEKMGITSAGVAYIKNKLRAKLTPILMA